MAGQLTIPAGDTRLAVTDSDGGAPPVLFINGAFATQRHWKPVLRRLGGRYRTVTFDARARGRSGQSADYSVASAAIDDLAARTSDEPAGPGQSPRWRSASMTQPTSGRRSQTRKRGIRRRSHVRAEGPAEWTENP